MSWCWPVVDACVSGTSGLKGVGCGAVVEYDVCPCLLFDGGFNVISGGNVVA